ncbi:MAG: acyl-CoA thioester hydrolase/BAAT C-terminal domain-containing protein [Pseudomonadota bacterium]
MGHAKHLGGGILAGLLAFALVGCVSPSGPAEARDAGLAQDITFTDVREPGGPIGRICAPQAPSTGAALVIIGGSGGGLGFAEPAAALACRNGYSALALAYWGYEGLPGALEEIPLEYFDAAIAWLGQQPSVDASKIGLVGYSRGGEGALLVASRNTQVAAMAGLVPGSHVGASIDFRDFFNPQSAWSVNGEPVAFATTRPNRPGADWRDVMADMPPPSPAQARIDYARLLALPEADAAEIPVAQLTQPLFLVSAGRDAVWASGPMTARIVETLAAAGFEPEVQVHAFGAASHSFMADALSEDGAHPSGDAAWAALLGFFDRHLGGGAD